MHTSVGDMEFRIGGIRSPGAGILYCDSELPDVGQ